MILYTSFCNPYAYNTLKCCFDKNSDNALKQRRNTMPKQSLDCVGGPFLDEHTDYGAAFLTFTVFISLNLNIKHYMFLLQGLRS